MLFRRGTLYGHRTFYMMYIQQNFVSTSLDEWKRTLLCVFRLLAVAMVTVCKLFARNAPQPTEMVCEHQWLPTAAY